MLSFVSFILMCVGCLNWFSIGILQYDFVAGIFGSQSNIFSRLIYTLVGVASIIVVANFNNAASTTNVNVPEAGEWTNLLTGEKLTLGTTYSCSLGASDYIVLVK